MVKGVGELKLGEGLPKGNFKSLVRMRMIGSESLESRPCLPALI
jgi:hypothetical protein